jgi:hypothetical protein
LTCLLLCLIARLASLQSIERHQLDAPIAFFADAAQQLRVLQVDNVRLTAQVGNLVQHLLAVRHSGVCDGCGE